MTKISPFLKTSKRALGPNQPTIKWVPASFWRKMKQPYREADHSLPVSDKIKNAYSYTSILPYAIPSLGEQGLPLILQQIIAGPCHGSAGSRRPLIPEARFQPQSSPCKICGEKSGNGTGFSRSTSVFISPPVLHAHTSPTLHNLGESVVK